MHACLKCTEGRQTLPWACIAHAAWVQGSNIYSPLSKPSFRLVSTTANQTLA